MAHSEWDHEKQQYTEDGPETTVLGNQIQVDLSGVGHCWRNIDREDIPAAIVEEIECEILDGGKEECGCFTASNGLHYRW